MNMHVNFLTEADDRILSVEEESYAVMMIPKAIRDNDKALFTSKWFDYRFMTPFEATMQYMRDYETIGRRIYRREIDMHRSTEIKFLTPERLTRVLRGEEVLKKSKMTSLKSKLTGYWRGRQVADALCMPYPVYLEEAITLRMRAWQRTYLPRPEMLYEMGMVERIQNRWLELRTSRNHFPDHHAFMIQNYQNLPVQNDFHEYLFEQSGLGGDRFFQLASFIENGLIPYEKVQSRLSEEEFQRVQEHL